MGFEMKDKDQQIIKFDFDQNFKNDDFFVSKSNKHILNMLNSWPKWEKNFINISGEKLSGKTHLVNVFIQRSKGIKKEANLLNNNDLKEIKLYQNVILENLNKNVDEKLLYSLINMVEQENKFLIITSLESIVNVNFNLSDLKSRSKNFLLLEIDKPDDELIYALILKNLSDRQIILDKKLINYIIKRIDRSYGKIFDFIYKIDEISLKRKKPIDYKIIKDVLDGGVVE